MKATERITLHLFILIVALSLSSALFAADMKSAKGVQLNDGKFIYGNIIKFNVFQVVIKEEDGSIVSVKFDDVYKFIFDEPESQTKQGKGPGGLETPISKELSEDRSKIQTTPATTARYAWEIGLILSGIKYKEPDFMEEKGMMYGIAASYAYHDKLMFKGEGRFSYGELDYDGQTQGGTPLTINRIPNTMWEFRGLLGYDMVPSDTTTITPYTGLAYRYLNDNSQSRSSAGYKREANYFYSPIGISVSNDFKNKWIIGFTVEYDLFWRGRQKSYFSDIDPHFNDIVNIQNSGYGLRGSLLIKKDAGRVNYSLEPYIIYWNIDQSDIQDLKFIGINTGIVGYEPQNTSTEVGLRYNVGY